MNELYSEKFPFNGKKCFWPFPIIFMPLGAGNEFLFWDHQHQTYMFLHGQNKLTELCKTSKSGGYRAYIEWQLFQNLKICVEMYVLPDVHTDGRGNISY